MPQQKRMWEPREWGCGKQLFSWLLPTVSSISAPAHHLLRDTQHTHLRQTIGGIPNTRAHSLTVTLVQRSLSPGLPAATPEVRHVRAAAHARTALPAPAWSGLSWALSVLLPLGLRDRIHEASPPLCTHSPLASSPSSGKIDTGLLVQAYQKTHRAPILTKALLQGCLPGEPQDLNADGRVVRSGRRGSTLPGRAWERCLSMSEGAQLWEEGRGRRERRQPASQGPGDISALVAKGENRPIRLGPTLANYPKPLNK